MHLADGDGGIIKCGRGGLPGSQVEGASEGIDGVDAQSSCASVHDGQRRGRVAQLAVDSHGTARARSSSGGTFESQAAAMWASECAG